MAPHQIIKDLWLPRAHHQTLALARAKVATGHQHHCWVAPHQQHPVAAAHPAQPSQGTALVLAPSQAVLVRDH